MDFSESNAAAGEDTNPAKIFIGNLPYTATKDTIASLCRRFGAVVGAKVVMDREKGGNKSKGFGFVTFRDANDAAPAVAGMNGAMCEGRRLTVKMATSRGTGSTGRDIDDVDPILASTIGAKKITKTAPSSKLPGWGGWS